MSRALLTIAAVVAATLFASAAYCAAEGAKDSKAGVKADQEPYSMDAWDFQDPAKFKNLMKEREDLQLKMQAARTRIINEDPDLMKLHKQIMALHKELAIQLESKREMRKLTDKLKDLDAELDKLPRKDSGK